MSKFSEQLHKVTADITLSSAEKSALRERVVSYMEHKPLRVKRQETLPSSFSIFSFSYVRYVAPVALFAVIFVSGGISYAAEGSVPGDVLYPIKVRVNEEVATALIFNNDEKKLTWNIRRAERRLEEASALASEGALSERVRSDLAAQFEVHVEEVAADVKAIEESNPALALEINSQFEASLMAHEEMLQQVSEGDDDARAEAGKFLARVSAKRTELSDTLAFADTSAVSFSAETGAQTMSLKMKDAPPQSGADAPEVSSEGEAFGIMALQEVSVSEEVPEIRATREDSDGAALRDTEDKYKEAALRLEKLVAVKIKGVQNLFKRHEDVLSKDQQESTAELIANIDSHAISAHERYEEGQYAEAFRKLRSLLLTVLRLEVYLRAVGEFDLSKATLPALPLGFPEFNQPLNKSDVDIEIKGSVDAQGDTEVNSDEPAEPKGETVPHSEPASPGGASIDLEVEIDNPLSR